MKKPRSANVFPPGTHLANAHTHLCLTSADCWLEYYRNVGNQLFWYGMLIGFVPFVILLVFGFLL